MRNILCYGDSNTWGFVPGTFGRTQRYDRKTRWTGRLQQMLGPEEYYVIEEGLNNRTTNVDPSSKPPGYRGTEFLLPILHSHAPLDLVIIMLGINDLKLEFHNRTSKDISQGMKEMIDIIQSTYYGSNMQDPPGILVVSTPLPVHTESADVKNMFGELTGRLKHLAQDLQELTNQYGENVNFVDAAPHVQLSPIDGIHFDEKAHENFAILIDKTIRGIFQHSN